MNRLFQQVERFVNYAGQDFENQVAGLSMLLIVSRPLQQLAHLIGWTYLHLRARWVPPLGGFILTILAVGTVDYFFGQKPLTEIYATWNHKTGEWFNIWTILAVYTIAWLLIWAAQARNRMVVERFVNYAGKDFENQVAGLSMLLVVRLGQFHDLYRAVDEQRAIPTAASEDEQRAIPTTASESEALDATIDVDNVESFLKDAVSSQSKLSLGPLEIPVGTLMSLIGHFAQGPRIIGSFHQDKSMFILTAKSTRNGKSFNWSVERPLPPGQPTQPFPLDLTDMIDELTCRIFTDMALRSTVLWRATSSFSDGLRAYRECLRTPKNRIINLQRAEEKFVETVTEDTQFTLAYYNLGVVLTELKRKEAAIEAFGRAISKDPNSWAAYYALALSCYQDRQFYRTSQICKRVIELNPGLANMAKAYQLRAKALEQLAVEEQKSGVQAAGTTQLPKEQKSERYDKAIKDGYSAITHSHRALYWAEIAHQDDAARGNDRVLKAKTLVGVCLYTLAEIYNKEAIEKAKDLDKEKRKYYLSRAKKLLKGALTFRSSDATYEALYHWELGKTYHQLQKYSKATHQLRIAARAAPYSVEYWADLLLSYAYAVTWHEEEDNEKYKEYLFQTIIDFASDVKKKRFGPALDTALEAYSTALEAYKKLTSQDPCYIEKCDRIRKYSDRIKAIQEFLDMGKDVGVYDPEKGLENTDSSLKAKYDEELRELNNVSAPPNEYTLVRQILRVAQVVFALGRLRLRLSERPSGDEPYHLQELKTELEELGRWEGYLDRLVTNEIASAADNKHDNEQKRKWEWEHGQILRILAILSCETGERKQKMKDPDATEDFKQAAEYYEKAIQVLADKHPREVTIHNLRSSQASVLSRLPDEKHKQQTALELAYKAIMLDALTCENYEILGDVYFARKDFADAINAWKEAVLRKNTTAVEPNNPQLYMKLGKAYIELAQSRHGLCLSDEECQEAIRWMEHALKCCTGEHVPERLQIYYSLGYFHCIRAEYVEAIKYLRLAQSFAFAPCTSTFYLAYSFMQNGEYSAAIEQFRKLAHLTDQMHGPTDEIVEKESIGHITLGEMKALALWGQAYIWAERDVHLSKALDLAKRAYAYAAEVKNPLQFPARYAHCRGWLLYKLNKSGGTVSSQIECIKESIKFLEQALETEAEAEIYLHLALAYTSKLPYITDDSETLRLMTSIRVYCQHARDLGLNDRYLNQQLDDLLQRLPFSP